MKVTKDETATCEVVLTIEVDDKQKQAILKKAARRIAKSVKVPGFRPGKAPYKVVLNRFGEEALREEAMQELNKDVYEKAIEDVGVAPFAAGAIEELTWEPSLSLKVKVPTVPVVELGDYRNLRLEADEIEVDVQEVENQLIAIRNERTQPQTVDRAVQMGDVVVMEVIEKNLDTSTVGEPRTMNWTMFDYPPDPTSPDFSAHLIDRVAGDEGTFTHKNSDGETIEYFVSIQEVRGRDHMPIDDDFAKSVLPQVESLEELRTFLERQLTQEKQRQADDELLEEALKVFVEEAKVIAWPLALEEQHISSAVNHYANRIMQSGMDFNAFLKTQQKTVADLREDMRESVQEYIRTSLILSEIGKLEEVTLDEHEIFSYYNWLAQRAGSSKEMRNVLKDRDKMYSIMNEMMSEKTREHVLNLIKGKLDNDDAEPSDENGAADVAESDDAPESVDAVADEATA